MEGGDGLGVRSVLNSGDARGRRNAGADDRAWQHYIAGPAGECKAVNLKPKVLGMLHKVTGGGQGRMCGNVCKECRAPGHARYRVFAFWTRLFPL